MHAYAVSSRTDPAPIVLEPLLIYREARRERLRTDELVEAFHRKLSRASEFRAASDVALQAAYRGDVELQDLLRAFRRDTWLRISLLADGEALVSRGVDPFAR